MLRKAYVEISNLCNLNCSFCPGTRRKACVLSPADFRILAEKLRGHTEYLYFHVLGEPLLHPQLEELLAIAGELGFHVMITTNGTLLPQRGGILLASPAVHKVNLSLQSFEANGRGELEDYMAGCIAFVREAAQRGILCDFRLWNRGGLEQRNQEILSLLKQSFPGPWIRSRNGEKLAQGVWLDPGDLFDWPDLDLEEISTRGFCYGLRDQIGILADGTVVPCCLDHEGDIPLGNLLKEDLETILQSPRARAIYEGFSRREAVEPLCRRCGYARRFS